MDYLSLLSQCTLCPRMCRVDRLSGETGFCGAGASIKAARAALHLWEEPCISGERGSGTVFFAGCSLKCVFCQNYAISTLNQGKEIPSVRLGEIFLELQAKGALNINLVSPTHFVPQILEAIIYARKSGLSLPIVYNSSGYENVETIKLLDGYIDIYLPDFKYFSDEYANKYSNAPEYRKYAKASITEMVRQVGAPCFDKHGIMKKGVIIRHLMLPGLLGDTKMVIKEIYESFGDSVYLSLMNQYTPMENVKNYPEINRALNPFDYEEAINFALELGITKGFIQDGETVSESYIPNFDCEGI